MGAKIWYQTNVLRLNRNGYFYRYNFIGDDDGGLTVVTSNCFADRATLLAEIEARIAHMEGGGEIVWSEPGRPFDGFTPSAPIGTFANRVASIDIRHGDNCTGQRHPNAGGYMPCPSPYWPESSQFWAAYDG